MHPRAKLSITDPLKFGSPVFRVSTEMENWCRPLQKMGKMAIAPQKRILEQNFQFTNPPKVWVSSFPSVDGNGKLVSAITENGKNGCSFPKMHPRTKLPITNPPKVWVSPWKCPRAKVFILPHESPMCSFTLPNIIFIHKQQYLFWSNLYVGKKALVWFTKEWFGLGTGSLGFSS